MDAQDNAAQNVDLTLRNLLNSVQCVTARVRDGEPNERDGDFNLSNFWDTLGQAVKAVSQEATKVSLAFSKPPVPSQQDGEQLADSVLKSVLSLATIYYWLPKSQGVSLRQQVRDATVQVLEGLMQLLEVILTSPLQSLTQEQLRSTGGVWSACDRFTRLPQDNKAAVVLVLTGQSGIVKDAIEELEQALSEAHDPFGDILDDEEDGEEPRGNRDTYWSERDRRVVATCQGMMKAAAACLRKTTAAVRTRGDARAPQSVAQLDDLIDGIKGISPGVDDLALCVYPPLDYNSVDSHVTKLAALLKKVLAIIRSSHICGEAELTWVQFLNGAVDHNLQKAKDLLRLDS
ncbi:cyclin-D1-binding protein 1 homolog [Hippocampus zosterae]|uniref:cyclin-D1-binding protein 1 homolog n=1 Tax=Hippocampus zosterae TaxID=109293 RepID=UPI00223CFBA0|nr:cyclin-D1-binding protein 1 homolog [Hippocampus zosterae]